MKRKRMIPIIMICLMVSLLLAASAAAQGSTVWIYPFDEETFELTPEDEVNVFSGWIATTPGLARINQFKEDYSFVLYEGEDVIQQLSADDARAYWRPIFRVDPAEYGLDCPMPNIYQSWWVYPLGNLEEGSYTLVFTIARDTPTNDGFHVCTDTVTGEPAAPTPSLYLPGGDDFTVYIEVAEPPGE